MQTAMCLLVFIFGTQVAVADNLGDVENRIKSQRQALERGAGDLAAHHEWLAKTVAQERQLKKSESNLASKQKKMAREIQELEVERVEARAARELLKNGAAKAVPAIVAAGEGGMLKILFGRTSFSDIVIADLVLQSLFSEAAQKVVAYAQAAERAEQLSLRLSATKVELKQAAVQQTRSLKILRSAKNIREKTTAHLRSDLSLRRQTLAALESEALRLRDLIESQSKSSTGEAPRVKVSIAPGSPRIMRAFGPYRDKTTGLKLHSTGVVLAAIPGTPIRAAADGEVVYADWFRGFGWLVIVQHQGGYYSLYGHCSELRVAAGKPVGAGDLVGLSGASGSLDGPSIYFEVRRGTSPINPLEWIASR